MKRLFAMCVVFALVLATGSLLLAQGDPFVGTWKLNLAKSKYDPGPPPQSQTRKWDDSGQVNVEGIGATGKPTSYGYPVKGDGKEYPTTGAVPNAADTISTKRIDANTIEANFAKAGKHVETATFKISNGGKTLTITAKGVLPTGQALNNVLVWDKQ